MLTIRNSQMRVITAPKIEAFVERVRHHLAKCFPDAYRAIGGGAMAAHIRHGIERATRYGFASQREIVLYINLMFVFGSDFDKDPDFPWAADILDDNTLPQSQRMEKLYFAGQVHAHEGCGLTAASATTG